VEARTAEISNKERGDVFRDRVRGSRERVLGESFSTEVKLPIGCPAKLHAFDLVSTSRKYVCECKAYTWTTTGNAPSAKISTLLEAVQYLTALPDGLTPLLVMQRDLHRTRGESLADHFVRLNSYLLGKIVILELQTSGGELRTIHGKFP
jgi:hypothetical protein